MAKYWQVVEQVVPSSDVVWNSTCRNSVLLNKVLSVLRSV